MDGQFNNSSLLLRTILKKKRQCLRSREYGINSQEELHKYIPPCLLISCQDVQLCNVWIFCDFCWVESDHLDTTWRPLSGQMMYENFIGIHFPYNSRHVMYSPGSDEHSIQMNECIHFVFNFSLIFQRFHEELT